MKNGVANEGDVVRKSGAHVLEGTSGNLRLMGGRRLACPHRQDACAPYFEYPEVPLSICKASVFIPVGACKEHRK